MVYSSTLTDLNKTCNLPSWVRDNERHRVWIRVALTSRSTGHRVCKVHTTHEPGTKGIKQNISGILRNVMMLTHEMPLISVLKLRCQVINRYYHQNSKLATIPYSPAFTKLAAASKKVKKVNQRITEQTHGQLLLLSEYKRSQYRKHDHE